MFVVHEHVTTAGISNYIKCIWEASLVFSFFDCCQDSQLFNDYARLIGLDQNMAVEDHVDLDAVFHSLSELASFRRKQSPVKSGRWFSWNTACEEQIGEFFAMRMLLLHKYPGGNPDSNSKSFSQMRSDAGGFRLALQCCSWSVWLGVQVLRLVGKPCWDYYTQRVEGIKSPSQGLARTAEDTANGKWMSCSHLRGLVNVFWQKDEFDRIVKYHALSSTHLDDQTCSLALETFVLQIWYHTLSVLSKRSSALSKLSAPPECYVGILYGEDEAANAAEASLLADWRMMSLAEQSAAAQDLVRDIRFTVSAPVRLAYLCFEANKKDDGKEILRCLLKTIPDSKFIEDLHQQVKTDALANANRKQSPAQVQNIVTNSGLFESRGIPHPAALDKAVFLRRWARTRPQKLNYTFQAKREKLPPEYSKIMGKKAWASLSEENLARSSAAWQWLRLFVSNQLKQRQLTLDVSWFVF